MDKIREWISDNLRYLILGVGILILVLILFLGIRGCTKSNKNTDPNLIDLENMDPDDAAAIMETVAVEELDEEPLVQDDAAILDLVRTYYLALGNRDGNALSGLVVNMTSAAVSQVMNANNYISEYDVEHVYSKMGVNPGEYIVFVKYTYSCNGHSTRVPALSRMYIVTTDDGELKIDANAEYNTEISDYMAKVMNDSDVKALTSEAEAEYNQVIASDTELAAFLDSIGEASNTNASSVPEGGTMRANEDCNVRAEASSESDLIGGLYEGDEVTVLGREGDWIIVDYDGQTGYVRGDLLSE